MKATTSVFVMLLIIALISPVKGTYKSSSFPYQEGWPIIGEKTQNIISQAVNVADVDNDGKMEIFLPFLFNGEIKVFGWMHNGSTLTGWPWVSEKNNVRGVAIGSLIDYAGLELTLITEAPSGIFLVHILRSDGQEFTEGGAWPKSVDGPVFKGPILEDIDNDFQLEIIVGAGCKIYAWNSDGSDVPGFPATLGDSSIVITGMAVGDLDNDGNKEIVAASMTLMQKQMFVVSNNGNVVYSWSPQVTDTRASENNPILADLDKDNKKEVIITSYSEVLVYLLNGTELWKKQVQGSASSPAVGDINLDGYLEIIVCGSTKIYAWNRNGNLMPNWPIEVPNVTWTGYETLRNTRSVVIGNIDFTRKPEIVLNGFRIDTKTWVIYAFSGDGYLIDGFPIIEDTNYAPEGTPALTDVDSDGDIEIISYAEDTHIPYLAYFKVAVYDLPYPYLSKLMTWPMFQQNPQRTGCYSFPVEVGGFAFPVDKLGLLAPYITIASIIIAAAAATTFYVKYKKRRQ
jgi:hypothetical protein